MNRPERARVFGSGKRHLVRPAHNCDLYQEKRRENDDRHTVHSRLANLSHPNARAFVSLSSLTA